MFRWRLYYEDGSTFSDSDGPEWEAPQYPAQLAQPGCEGNEKIPQNGDYLMYRKDLGHWTQCGERGLPGQFYLHARHITAVLETLWASGTVKSGVYGEILARARSDCGLKI